MGVLPDALAGHLATSALGGPGGWVLVDRGGRIAEWGGDLERFGLASPGAGAAVADWCPALCGLVPLGGAPAVLPLVELARGLVADLFLFPAGELDCALFLDAAADRERRLPDQQLANERAFLRERIGERATAADDGGGAVLDQVLDHLDVAAYERRAPGTFRRIGRARAWAAELLGGDDRAWEAAGLLDSAPFLEAWLHDAERAWSAGVPGSLRSGSWVQDVGDRREAGFEAIALRLASGRCALLLMRSGERHQELATVLQSAREGKLEHGRLRREIDRREILLHCVVHDLRGPLSAILGSLTLLEGRELPADKRARLIEVGRSQAERQERMIRDLLDVFASEVRQLADPRLDPAEAPDLGACTMAALAQVEAEADRAGLRLEVDPRLEGGPEIAVHAEVDRLVRVIGNLLDNAVRHSPRGGALRVTCEPDDGAVLLAVEDEGPGVPEELRESLFQRFVQGRGSKKGAAGLGLFSCRIAVEAWGGSIGCEPRDGGGSRFWFRLAIPAVPGPDP